MTTSFKLSVLLALMVSGAAQGQIYKCQPPGGSVEFTDINRGSYCKLMDLPGVTVPAPVRRAAPAPRNAQPVAAPGEFPRVDSAEQRARDADRRGILEDELKTEMQKLAELRREFNNGEPERRGDERNYAKYQERTAALRDSISRSEKNVDALKREIANIR
ncbi:hypothetical protein SAMN05216319_3996 [Duganella sp. CF402]|uniref:DUF4124 domain-containing protein n=1 Tax=unclassified Duganella TaxID=2636909 RepID=UPI0008AAC6DD|nr:MULTISPECIES: DUF4124 domain-containing protein [unclassified Duganella]RZT04225.1 hypothetical protein EV582_5109 [Duganella sp. BK701]SEM43543.1 hypothetical protein SAMN05216319_3996 [Duganella sp. CF402]